MYSIKGGDNRQGESIASDVPPAEACCKVGSRKEECWDDEGADSKARSKRKENKG